MEYVLDYILERKRVDDLHSSIKDRRYDKQKYNMQRCGLRHLVYLVEGDPDTLGDDIGGCCWAHGRTPFRPHGAAPRPPPPPPPPSPSSPY